MTEPIVAQSPDRIYPLLHKILVAGVVITIVVFGIVRSVVPLDPMTGLVPMLRVAALVLLVGGYLVMRSFRTRIPPMGSDAQRSAWWQQHGPRAATVWVMSEGIAMVGAVFWFLTGDVVLLVGVAGVALALMMMNRPGRLVEG